MDLGGKDFGVKAGEEQQFFGRLAERLRQKVEKAHFETWLSRLQCRGAKDGILEFIAPNAFTKDWIQRHYQEILKEAARSMDGRSWRILLYQGSELADSIDGYPCLGSLGVSGSISGKASLQFPSNGASPAASGTETSRAEISGSGNPFPLPSVQGSGSPEGFAEGKDRKVLGRVGRDQGKESFKTEKSPGAGSSEEGGASPFWGFPGRETSGGKRETPSMNAPLFLSQGAPENGATARKSKKPASGKSSLKKTGNLEFFSQNSDSALNPSFTLENLVIGACNELSVAAGKAVAEFPGGPYNPLFVHGSSGLGKTHLLQGICHGVLRGQTPRRILYLSSENFINQFIQAVTNGNISDFRYNCRHVDMLLIDDIQMLEGKSRTQEEFFHTFNTLFNNQKQIVLSSDRPPKELRTLQDRLISRFGWGMVTRLDSPCLETRVAIVKRKARMRNFEISDEVSRFLAEHVDTNVRELEGAVTKLLGMANLMKRRIDLSLAEEILHDYRPSTRRVPIQKIMESVAREFGIQSRELQSKTRVHSVVMPRQVAILLARRHTRLSLKQIGGFFGDRNHATVMHSIKKAEQILEESEEIRERIQELTTKLLREG